MQPASLRLTCGRNGRPAPGTAAHSPPRYARPAALSTDRGWRTVERRFGTAARRATRGRRRRDHVMRGHPARRRPRDCWRRGWALRCGRRNITCRRRAHRRDPGGAPLSRVWPRCAPSRRARSTIARATLMNFHDRMCPVCAHPAPPHAPPLSRAASAPARCLAPAPHTSCNECEPPRSSTHSNCGRRRLAALSAALPDNSGP